MMGAFAMLQKAYAAHRVAVYPLTDTKTPAVRGYDRVGAQGARQLAMKFPNATAAGFVAGRRNRLSVIDIDSPDDRLVAEIEARFGETPLQVVTPSGGRHLYYRHAGEARRIRPLPYVDILGGGHVVAALSVVARGRYEIVRGSLDDLAFLPTMRGLQDNRAPARIAKGQRNNALFDYCRSIVPHCDDLDQLLDAARTWADAQLDRFAGPDPTTDAEIVKTCRNVWKFRGGRKAFMDQIIDGPRFKALMANPAATTLFVFLWSENALDAEFMVADGLGKAMGWSCRFVPTARRALLELGIIRCVRPPALGRAARYRWAIDPDLADSLGLPLTSSEKEGGKVNKDHLANSQGLGRIIDEARALD
jgi:Bifunctional DNA primase/polymerase, N-terminal